MDYAYAECVSEMGASMTVDDCQKAIKSCEWRKSMGADSSKGRKNGYTLYFCEGMLGVCDKVIDRGSCPTLKEMFRKDTLE